MLWVSSYIDNGVIWFVLGINDGVDPPTIYSLTQRSLLAECAFQTSSSHDVERVFCSFFERRHSDVFSQLFQLKPFSFTP